MSDASRYAPQPPQYNPREPQSDNGAAENSSEQPYRSQTQRDYSYDPQRYAYRFQDPRYGDERRDRDYGRDSQPRSNMPQRLRGEQEMHPQRRGPDTPAIIPKACLSGHARTLQSARIFTAPA
jgi:hypothetical protein